MNTDELRIYLRTVADTSGARQTQDALRGVQRQGAQSSAAIGASAGVAAAATQELLNLAGRVVDVYGQSTQAVREHERVVRATAMAYGQQAEQFQRFATALEGQTGITSDAILEAALSARTLSQNYGLSIQQTQGLIRVSADLARVRGIGLPAAFQRVSDAIRGETESSEYLGLTLGETFLAEKAREQGLKTTLGTLTEAQKAQIRLNELLKQSAQFTGLASDATDSLDAAFGRAEVAGRKLQITLGELTKPATIAGLNALATAMDIVARGGQLNIWRQELEALTRAASSGGGRGGFDQAGATTSGFLSEAARNAYIAQQARLAAQQRRLQEANELPRLSAAASMREIAYLDQLDSANRDLSASLDDVNRLQRESVQLIAEQANITLRFLPAQQALAATERQLAQARIAAQQAGLPASEALEDLRYEQQRAQLIARNRNASIEDRRQARLQLRELGRAAPGVELRALEAQRAGVGTERELARLQLAQQALQGMRDQAEAPVAAMVEQNRLLSQVAEALTQQREMTVRVIVEGAVSGSGGAVSVDDARAIAAEVGKQTEAQVYANLHSAMNEAERAASGRLSLGGRGPS